MLKLPMDCCSLHHQLLQRANHYIVGDPLTVASYVRCFYHDVFKECCYGAAVWSHAEGAQDGVWCTVGTQEYFTVDHTIADSFTNNDIKKDTSMLWRWGYGRPFLLGLPWKPHNTSEAFSTAQFMVNPQEHSCDHFLVIKSLRTKLCSPPTSRRYKCLSLNS